MKSEIIDRLFERLDKSTCNFLAVKTIGEELDKKGFIELKENEDWHLKIGSAYYMKKNDSAIFAFIIGEDKDYSNIYKIIAAHSDSPSLKIKPNAEIYKEGGAVCLNVEKYGGGILYTWFDRPLSISGRVVTASDDIFNPRSYIFDLRKPVATIPHLAIHFNRSVNDGNPISVQKDMLPVIGYYSPEEISRIKSRGGALKVLIAEHLSIQPEEILDYEINLYPIIHASYCGVHNEYFQSGRIDDLSMAFAALESLLMVSDTPDKTTRLMAIFDNEETGSGTKQGAASPVLKNIMERISLSLGHSREKFLTGIADSFLISADDAHAWHPNYNEKYDPTNHPIIGGGPVVKINANCKYMSDAVGAAIFVSLCKKAGVPSQYFVNHSDVAGGSTLGNILTSQLDMRGADVGSAIWGMHSACETAGVADHEAMVKVFNCFWNFNK